MSYFGIDLGTTNSLIGNAATGYLSDLVPSCVDMNTHKAGATQYSNPKATRSFKVNMSLGIEGAVPRQASTCVLQELKRQTNGVAKDVMISVPAYFNDSQRQATVEAAVAAGFNVIGLINEPTAAAAYIARSKKSLFVVMDLGGGTFDVSVVDSRYGPYIVQATDGRIIGGDNLDRNIMKYLTKQAKVPWFLMDEERRNAFRIACTGFKLQMSHNYGKDVIIDLSEFNGPAEFKFKKTDYIKLMVMSFKETIDLTHKIINENLADEDYEILLVGGSTKDPYYQAMVKEEFGKDHVAKIDYDPDRVVAQGAAYCAMLTEQGKFSTKVHDVTKGLMIGRDNGICTPIVEPNSSIPLSVTEMYSNAEDSDKLYIPLYQGTSAMQKDNELIGELYYPYGVIRPANTGIVYVTVEIDTDGVITFKCAEPMRDPVVVKLDRKNI